MLTRCLRRQLSCINAKAACSLAQRASFASAVPATKPVKSSRATFEMGGKLIKAIDSEIQYHKEFLEGEEAVKIETVTEKHKSMLNEQGWSIESKEDSTIVELTTERGDLKVVIRFDAEIVSDSINNSINDDYEEEDYSDGETRAEEEVEDDEDDLTDDDDMAASEPFNLTVELHRPSALPGKFIELELEAIPGPDASDAAGSELYINSIAVRHEDKEVAGESYTGPRYESLDEELREQFDGWAKKNLRHLVPFIGEFSQAKEAKEYGKWLDSIKTFASKN